MKEKLNFKKNVWGGHRYPCFELLVTSPLGFKTRVGSFICAWQRHICVTCSLRFTSGVTPANLLVASMTAKPFSSTCLQAGIGGAQNQDLSCHHSQCETRQILHWLSYSGSAFKFYKFTSLSHQFLQYLKWFAKPVITWRIKWFMCVITGTTILFYLMLFFQIKMNDLSHSSLWFTALSIFCLYADPHKYPF